MEKVRPWCGQPSDRGRLKNRNRNVECNLYENYEVKFVVIFNVYASIRVCIRV